MCLCAALIKVMLAYEHQTLPANLHFTTPNPNNAGLKDGILKVVTEPTEFKQGVVALSNFGFGGALLRRLALPAFVVLECYRRNAEYSMPLRAPNRVCALVWRPAYQAGKQSRC